MKFINGVLCLVTILIFISCGDGKDEEKIDCNAVEVQLEAELENVLELAFDYAFDPSAEKCTTYKNALNEFLDVAENARPCAEDKQEFDEGIKEFEDGLAEIDC